MKLSTTHVLFTALMAALFILFWSSCKPKCDAGFDRESGDCVCPVGRFEVNDSCVALLNNQFYWIRNCDCFQDTVRVKLLQIAPYGVPITEFQVQKYITVLSIYSSVGQGEIDTISTGSNLHNGYCNVLGKDCEVKFEGKLVHSDTIRGNLVYRWSQNLDSIIQKCPTQMWRK